MWKNFLQDYCSFTRKERTGITALLLLIGCFILLPFLFPFFIDRNNITDPSFKKEMEQLLVQQVDSANRFFKKYLEDITEQGYREEGSKNEYAKKVTGELFNFDPNTLDEAGWKRLGIRDKTIATIIKYTTKGGRFKQPEDLGKIWGLFPEQVTRLIPYVKIISNSPKNNPEKPMYSAGSYNKSINKSAIIDINTADTAELIALPGIGSKLSQRILNFRDKLGGFDKVEQIGETFGLPDSTFQQLRPRFTVKPGTVHQININTATVDEMKAHPYLRYAFANAIVQYRLQHGNYFGVEDLKKIMLVTDEWYAKAAPYLKVN